MTTARGTKQGYPCPFGSRTAPNTRYELAGLGTSYAVLPL